MANRVLSDLYQTLKTTFAIAKATLDASGLTAARTFTLPDAGGTVALTTSLPPTRTASGTTDTITSSDNNKVIYYTNASAVAVTVNNTLGVGFTCTIVQSGAGQVTVSAGASMTRRQRQAYTKTAGQYAIANIHCHTAGEFILQGDLA